MTSQIQDQVQNYEICSKIVDKAKTTSRCRIVVANDLKIAVNQCALKKELNHSIYTVITFMNILQTNKLSRRLAYR